MLSRSSPQAAVGLARSPFFFGWLSKKFHRVRYFNNFFTFRRLWTDDKNKVQNLDSWSRKWTPRPKLQSILKMERLRVTFSHLSGVDNPGDAPNLVTTAAAAKRFPDSADDVVIVSARRTPIAKGNRGSFKVKSSGNLAGLSVNGYYKLMFTYYRFTFYDYLTCSARVYSDILCMQALISKCHVYRVICMCTNDRMLYRYKMIVVLQTRFNRV